MTARAKLKEYRAKRDFSRTREPSGEQDAKRGRKGHLAFLIQRHEASHLHYDLRLEVDGVMKSWSVPKGPSFDPKVKRLAVQVEDHPMAYNEFEGTIPSGEYGGGTVMIWDFGHYTVDDLAKGGDPEEKMQEDIDRGKLSITFHGKHMRGSFALIRMARRRNESKPQWLLVKHQDDSADPDYDPVSDVKTSAKSGQTMEELKSGPVWRSSKSSTAKTAKEKSPSSRFLHSTTRTKNKKYAPEEPQDVPSPKLVLPMLVSIAEDLPLGPEWVYEQKIDGIRVLAYVEKDSSALITRLGNDKAIQFPEIGEALQKIAARLEMPFVIDGEICAVDSKGQALNFQNMQGRIHLDNHEEIHSERSNTKVAFFAFDVLICGEDSLLKVPWSDRRQVLEMMLANNKDKIIRLVKSEADPETMKEAADKAGWEGLIAKRIDSTYQPGKRVKTWLKWRTMARGEFLILGWTEPRGTRQNMGSLLLGYRDEEGHLKYAGHAGSGLNREILASLHKALQSIERETPPLKEKISTNNTAHWVEPQLIAEVQFKEWTEDGMLRQASFLGLRDDKPARDVVVTEEEKDLFTEEAEPAPAHKPKATREDLHLTHLDKVFFPKEKITKQDLLDYYEAMADNILPWMKDRPLVLRRFPNGIEEKAFYQQTPDDNAPGRVELVDSEQGRARRLIGGDLITLLYLVQIGTISYDPWHARIQSLEYPDYSIIDLDPVEGTKFSTVRHLARECMEFFDKKSIPAAMKTSGATGIHIYLPLPKRTSWETSVLISEIVCTQIAEKFPKLATVERSVKKRHKGSVYMDSQQNFIAKSVAGVWCVRARPGAPVSTPISIKDLDAEIVPEDLNMVTALKEAKKRQKLWDGPMSHPIVIEKLLADQKA